eukprot:8498655-Alexandrium_andersonii.AAC.1
MLPELGATVMVCVGGGGMPAGSTSSLREAHRCTSCKHESERASGAARVKRMQRVKRSSSAV